jgi:hypothetical protein
MKKLGSGPSPTHLYVELYTTWPEIWISRRSVECRKFEFRAKMSYVGNLRPQKMGMTQWVERISQFVEKLERAVVSTIKQPLDLEW